jgi:hypothetical protein
MEAYQYEDILILVQKIDMKRVENQCKIYE